ncbi:predicted protein [Histoplasma mississippiense (nom. inval.)]|uniref:predicted protein n=1 Tax=Ajellomyces capsulatus (strain NAm1 / WU24) TaxID=2059318 RepID=UPI000157CFA9|nr:predicted protein [Histoplasma mississippiense (nom. inval.)]EDN10982.1 predicted protein [Histoplasma mississippiense (nom. inval.)]
MAIITAKDLIVTNADVLNVNVLQSVVTAAVKFFAVKIYETQQNGFFETLIETVIDEISVTTSLIAAFKSSLKHHVSLVEKIRSNKQICFDDNFLNDTDQPEILKNYPHLCNSSI